MLVYSNLKIPIRIFFPFFQKRNSKSFSAWGGKRGGQGSQFSAWGGKRGGQGSQFSAWGGKRSDWIDLVRTQDF